MLYYLYDAMTRFELKAEAQRLRKKAWSIGRIAEELGVSKSSASLWSRNTSLTESQKALIKQRGVRAGHGGRLRGAEVNRKKKQDVIAEYVRRGKIDTTKLTAREVLLLGIAIYWGEGSKVGQLSFVNTDASMVLFMYGWFQSALGVDKKDFMPRIYINERHRDRKKQVETFWSALLELPRSQFRPTVFLKRPQKKRYPNRAKYHGLLSLRVRNSTHLKYRILGLIEGLKCSKF